MQLLQTPTQSAQAQGPGTFDCSLAEAHSNPEKDGDGDTIAIDNGSGCARVLACLHDASVVRRPGGAPPTGKTTGTWVC